MTHIITSLCLRDASCAEVCPVECIVPGKPQERWPWYYIDPETCIDCGACVTECPYNAIFPEDEVPAAFLAKGGEYQSMPAGTPGFEETYDGVNHHGNKVYLEGQVRILKAGEEVDLTGDIAANYDFFKEGVGPGYKALD